MRQHERSVPVSSATPAPTSAPAPRPLRSPRRTSPPRLGVAFLLGATAPFFLSPLSGGPWWWQPGAAIGILLLAAIMSETVARTHSPNFSSGLVFRGPVATTVAIGALAFAFLDLRRMAEAASAQAGIGLVAAQWNILAAAFIPALIGLASALVAQRRPRFLLALGAAVLGWLAASGANILNVFLSPSARAAGLTTNLAIAAALSLAGFTVALLGGILGWGLGSLAAHGATSRET